MFYSSPLINQLPFMREKSTVLTNPSAFRSADGVVLNQLILRLEKSTELMMLSWLISPTLNCGNERVVLIVPESSLVRYGAALSLK
jgi:hypothetical protein